MEEIWSHFLGFRGGNWGGDVPGAGAGTEVALLPAKAVSLKDRKIG